jgi:hypothetical protein
MDDENQQVDWSVDDSGYATAGAELNDYMTSQGYEDVQPWQNVSTTGDTTSGNMYGNSSLFSGSDLAKLFKDSPLLQTLGAVGMGKLADKLFDVQKGPGGYRGGIPTLTASRQQLPIPTTMMNAAGTPMLDAKGVPIPRRPGSGGITYFTPMQYLKAGQVPASTAPAESVAAPAESVAAPVEVAAAGGLMGYARGGIANLGGYSDGGRLLRGPGDGVSDSIPATIGRKQPARLADGEFVIPARIVSELGNGSTEAGARKLYAMMDRIKKARGKAKNIAADTKSDKHLPA